MTPYELTCTELLSRKEQNKTGYPAYEDPWYNAPLGLTYLSFPIKSPYNDDTSEKAVRLRNNLYEARMKFAYKLSDHIQSQHNIGVLSGALELKIISAICHHPYNFDRRDLLTWDIATINVARHITILDMPGAPFSTGMAAELSYAKATEIPITYVTRKALRAYDSDSVKILLELWLACA